MKPTRGILPRRGVSVDGDSVMGFDTSYILRPQHINIMGLYTFEEELGRGAFGVVHRCLVRLTGQRHACKTILKSNLRSQLHVEDLKAEVCSLRAVQCHPAIVRLNGVFEDSKSVHLVMEYCDGGDLFNRIRNKGYFSEENTAMIISKLASILSCAHGKGIMHRDIKPENILLSTKDSETDIRLADFGSAAMFRPGQKLNQLIGSPLYIAPSVLQHSYGTEADMWSLGVVMFILLSGIPPFVGRNSQELFRSIQHDPLNLSKGKLGSVSEDAKHLISLLLNRKVEDTLSAADVLCHSWILKHCMGDKQWGITSQAISSAPAIEVKQRKGYSLTPATEPSRRHSLGVVIENQVTNTGIHFFAESSNKVAVLQSSSVLHKPMAPFLPKITNSYGYESDDE